ncbi:MAG: hypothetical protein H7242_13515 [Microbacteriaceae bacterium]|nr:hypothetical protein [Burkholderiaceae bacterium]
MHAPTKDFTVKTLSLTSVDFIAHRAKFAPLFAALFTASLMTACGGGDDTVPAPTGVAPAPVGPAPVVPVAPGPVTPAAFTLVGTAATGAAIAGGAVTANCTVGTASGTSAADGSFTLTLDKGQVAPCLLRVAKAAAPPAAAVELYGFAVAAGRVNITTLTDTALTRALAASPADVFATFDTARAAAINSALPAAISYLQAQFAASGLGTVPANLMTASFTIGDYDDKLLENMAAAFLGAGKTYADWIALVKNASDLITVTTPLPVTGSEITVPAAILALPLTGTPIYLKTAADIAGFAGSHVYGRGLRSNIQTTANPYPTFTKVTDCKLSVEGGDLVLSASGQTTRVPYTPRLTSSYAGVDYYSVTASVSPRNASGNSSYVAFVGPFSATFQADGITIFIANGVVTNVIANDAATGTQTTCGSDAGGNLNTDRNLDVLSLPTALVADLRTAATAKGLYVTETRTVSAAGLTGLAANVNFGRGVFTTYNADVTVKEVIRVNDCKVEVKDGKLRMTSAQVAYDHSFPLIYADYANSGAFNKDVLQFRGRETADLTSGNTKIVIDRRTTTPFVLTVESLDLLGKNSLICPRG